MWVSTGSSICVLKGAFWSGKTIVAPASRQRMRMENPLTWFRGSESNHAQPGPRGILAAAPEALAMCDCKSCHTARGEPLEPEVKSTVPAEVGASGDRPGTNWCSPSGFQKAPAPMDSARRRASSSGNRGLKGATKQSLASRASKSVAWLKSGPAHVAKGRSFSKCHPSKRAAKKDANSEYRTSRPLARSSKATASPKVVALERIEF